MAVIAEMFVFAFTLSIKVFRIKVNVLINEPAGFISLTIILLKRILIFIIFYRNVANYRYIYFNFLLLKLSPMHLPEQFCRQWLKFLGTLKMSLHPLL